jgi:hypothetical protein
VSAGRQVYTKEGVPRRRDAGLTDANVIRVLIEGLDVTKMRAVFAMGGWQVFTLDKMQPGTFYTDTARSCVFIHSTTWKTLSYSPGAQSHLVRTAYAGANGMKFLVMDSGPYGEAARAEAQVTKVDSRDALDTLEEDAQRLLVQAAGVTGAANQLQTQVFMQRYGDMVGRLEAYTQRLEHARQLVEMAGETVIESTS